MTHYAVADGCGTDRQDITAVVEAAQEGEGTEIQRLRFDGQIAEVRVRKAPLIGVKMEFDVRTDGGDRTELIPADVDNSSIEGEVASIVAAENDVTRLADVLAEDTYQLIVEGVAEAKDEPTEVIRETFDRMGICSQMFDAGTGCVATFIAHV